MCAAGPAARWQHKLDWNSAGQLERTWQLSEPEGAQPSSC